MWMNKKKKKESFRSLNSLFFFFLNLCCLFAFLENFISQSTDDWRSLFTRAFTCLRNSNRLHFILGLFFQHTFYLSTFFFVSLAVACEQWIVKNVTAKRYSILYDFSIHSVYCVFVVSIYTLVRVYFLLHRFFVFRFSISSISLTCIRWINDFLCYECFTKSGDLRFSAASFSLFLLHAKVFSIEPKSNALNRRFFIYLFFRLCFQ